jgi:hypothetical protein
MLLTILLIFVAIAVITGGVGQSRGWGVTGWSPLGIVLLILFVLWATGNLHGAHGIWIR